MKQQTSLLIWALLLAVVAMPVTAQSYRSNDAEAGFLTGFGGSAVVGDGEIIVGSTGQTQNAGELYIYKKEGNEWAEAGRIMASDGANDNRFGRALALHGSTLVVGATLQDAPQGAAYVFTKGDDGMWAQSAKLVPSETEENYGRAVAVNDDFALVATVSKNAARGGVYVFHNAGDGNWEEHSMLIPEGLEEGDYFGLSMALSGNHAIIGAPAYGNEGSAGAAYIFAYDEASNMWKQELKLDMPEMDHRGRFGHSVLIYQNYAAVGVPGDNQGTGSVYLYMKDGESGTWEQGGIMVPFDGTPGTQFGMAMGINDNGLWVGAPRASNNRGAVYAFDFDFATNMWMGAAKLHAAEPNNSGQFGSFFAANNEVALIGETGADGGLGIAHVFEKSDMGKWESSTEFYTEIQGMEPVVGAKVDCEEGEASLFGCKNVDLLSFVPIHELGGGRGARLNDIWGWTDSDTGVEYTLLGRTDGTSFVDISDPSNPVVVGTLPLTDGANSASWRDIKVYNDHAFIVADGAGQHGMQVFDLTQLRDVDAASMPVTFEQSALYDEVASVHNIVINEDSGFAFAVGSNGGGETCGGGLHIIDIRNQLQPTFAGCFSDTETGRSGTGYTHDAQCVIYSGPDTEHQGKEICLSSNETALSIADVSDKSNTIALSNADYPNVGYSHQGWLTEDQKYFYMNDELDEVSGNVSNTRTLIWDVQDLDDPQLVKEFFLETEASDHNLYIKGNLMYQSNYNAGLRIYDITDIENPKAVGHFDTNPFADEAGFDGSWSNYPYFESGVIAVSSIGQGLFLVKKSNIDI